MPGRGKVRASLGQVRLGKSWDGLGTTKPQRAEVH